MLEHMIKLSEGNPSALEFLQRALGDTPDINSVIIFHKIETCRITGINLSILWTNLCNKSRLQVAKLCRDCPDEVLINACSRQDYIGKELVLPYL